MSLQDAIDALNIDSQRNIDTDVVPFSYTKIHYFFYERVSLQILHKNKWRRSILGGVLSCFRVR